MGSVSRRIRSLPTRDLRRASAGLVKRALAREVRNQDCISGETERFADMQLPDWTIRLACRVHPAARGDADAEHWHLVMQLAPPGRPERPQDWTTLAEFVARVAELTGYVGPYIDALTSLDARPHAPHHFVWHADGALDDDHRRALSRRITLVETP